MVGPRRVAIVQVPYWLLLLVTAIVLLRITPLPFKRVFVIGFTAVLIASAVAPLATRLERYRIPRTVSIIGTYIAALAVIAGMSVLLVPLVAGEIDTLKARLPEYQSDFNTFLQRFTPPDAQPFSTQRIFSTLQGDLGALATSLTDLLIRIGSILVQALITLVAAYFLAVDPEFAERLVARFAPARNRERTLQIMRRCGSRLGHWVRAQLILALFFGTAFGIGLWALGIPYALTLGVVGGVLEIIPYVGGFVTVALAVLVAATTTPLKLIAVVILYTVVTNVEAHVLAPSVMGRVLGLHPLTVIVALFVGAEALGIIGALLSVPIAVVLQVLLDELYANAPPPDNEAPPSVLPGTKAPEESVPASTEVSHTGI